MKSTMIGILAVASLAVAGCNKGKSKSYASPVAPMLAQGAATTGGSRTGFGFNGRASGFPTGLVFLSGGGSFGAAASDASAGGGFSCVAAVAQGPLAGCAAGEGVRWDTAQLLVSTTFKCNGADALKSAATGPGTVVLQGDFYRAGDGTNESFTAQMIVADHDIAPDLPGQQTLWIQGVGCGDANAHFSR